MKWMKSDSLLLSFSPFFFFVTSISCLPDSCSGRSDRLAHLPLSSGHPEEDRAGQGVLTAPPAGLHGATQTKTRQQRQKEEGQADRGRSLETESSVCFPSVFLSSVRLSERNTERDREDLNQPSFLIPLSLFWKSTGQELVKRLFEIELEQSRGRLIDSDPAVRSFFMDKGELPSLPPVYAPLRSPH